MYHWRKFRNDATGLHHVQCFVGPHELQQSLRVMNVRTLKNVAYLYGAFIYKWNQKHT